MRTWILLIGMIVSVGGIAKDEKKEYSDEDKAFIESLDDSDKKRDSLNLKSKEEKLYLLKVMLRSEEFSKKYYGKYLCISESVAGHKWSKGERKYHPATFRNRHKYLVSIPNKGKSYKVKDFGGKKYYFKLVDCNVGMRSKNAYSFPLKENKKHRITFGYFLLCKTQHSSFSMELTSNRFVHSSNFNFSHPQNTQDFFMEVGKCDRVN